MFHIGDKVVPINPNNTEPNWIRAKQIGQPFMYIANFNNNKLHVTYKQAWVGAALGMGNSISTKTLLPYYTKPIFIE